MLEPPRTSSQAPCTPCFPCNDVVREGSVPSRTHVKEHFTPCYLCDEEVRDGSRRFAVLYTLFPI